MKHYISYLRVLASFAVILLHLSGGYVMHFEKYTLPIWNVSNLVDSITRFCVPVFLMVSGVLLLNKDEDLMTFLKKRYKRVLLPFLFWTTIYILFAQDFNSFFTGENLKTIVKRFSKGASFHFWYVYLILGIYLFIPIIRKWTIKNNKKEIVFFLLIWAVTLMINQKTKRLFPEIELRYFSGYLGYLILGYFLAQFEILKSRKAAKTLGILLFISGVFVTFYLTQIYSIKYQRFFFYFYDGLTLNVALASAGLFLIFLNSKFKQNNIITAFDSCSYGIYLVHMLVMGFIIKMFSFYQPEGVLLHLLYLFYVSVATFLVSFIIIYFLKKIPVLGNIVT